MKAKQGIVRMLSHLHLTQWQFDLQRNVKYDEELQMNLMKGFLIVWENDHQGVTM